MKRLRLDRALLLACEGELCALLKPFLAFRGHAIYFPASHLEKAELLGAERRLLAPILHDGRPHGALRLDGVQPREARPLLPFFHNIVALALKNVLVARTKELDGETGLLTGRAMFERLAARIQAPRAQSFGVIAISWPEGNAIAHAIGYDARDRLWRRMGSLLQKMLPDRCLAAGSGRGQWLHEFLIALPAPGRGACHKLATEAMSALGGLEARDNVARERIRVSLAGGHALFPQDLSGRDLQRPAFEQALLLRDRARLAAQAAARNGGGSMSFAWLLRRGGVVIDCGRDGNLRVSLGRASLARAGMRFEVVAPGAARRESKAQVILREVGETESRAEIFHFNRTDDPPAAGDSLWLIGKAWARAPVGDAPLDLASFLDTFARLAAEQMRFGLALTRIEGMDGARGWFAEAWRGEYGARLREQNCMAGFYGQDGLIIFRPRAGVAEMTQIAADLHKLACAAGHEPASGIFAWPFLNFSRGESEACVLKAWEYARLLPLPRIGTLDALALAISADKRMSMGDELGALEEYRLALLLAPADALILNSCGVCMAALNRREEARALFTSALNACADLDLRAKILYNLGNIHFRENNFAEAARFLKKCIAADGAHAWAWLRLGQIHAASGKVGVARAMFRHVEKHAAGNAELLASVRRRMARLEAENRQFEKARDILHDSLLANPVDAPSLLLMARAYLVDDPHMAETLARKCLRLGANAFEILAEALERQGRTAEGAKARARMKKTA